MQRVSPCISLTTQLLYDRGFNPGVAPVKNTGLAPFTPPDRGHVGREKKETTMHNCPLSSFLKFKCSPSEQVQETGVAI